jgi:hypothetical protein
VKWVKVFPAVVVVASVLVIIALTPSILTDPLVTAVTQVRQNAARTATPAVPSSNTENPYPEETSEQKASIKLRP